MESMENLNSTPEETPEDDVEKKTAEDLGINSVTGETPLDREMDETMFNQAENSEDSEEDLKEAA
jgi:hypothetical protein